MANGEDAQHTPANVFGETERESGERRYAEQLAESRAQSSNSRSTHTMAMLGSHDRLKLAGRTRRQGMGENWTKAERSG